MKTNVKLNSRTTKKPSGTIRPRKPRPKSSPMPIIIISICAVIIVTIVIFAAGGSKPQPEQAQIPAENIEKDDKGEVKESKPAVTSTKEESVEKKEVAKTADTVKSKPPEKAAEPVVTELPAKGAMTKVEVVSEETDEKADADEKTAEVKVPEVLPTDPRERSIAILTKIGREYKAYAETHQGHMPIALYQLELDQSDYTSPLTKTEYIVEEDGKGSFLKESLETVIVREAKAVNGKYICLLGNGTVKEFDAKVIEDNQ